MSETHGSDQAVKQNQRVRQKRLFGPLFCFLAKSDHTHHIKQTKSTAMLSLTAGGVIKRRFSAGPSHPSGGCTYTCLTNATVMHLCMPLAGTILTAWIVISAAPLPFWNRITKSQNGWGLKRPPVGSCSPASQLKQGRPVVYCTIIPHTQLCQYLDYIKMEFEYIQRRRRLWNLSRQPVSRCSLTPKAKNFFPHIKM